MINTNGSIKSQQSNGSSISEVDKEYLYEKTSPNSILDNLKGLINQKEGNDEVKSAMTVLEAFLKKQNTEADLVQREIAEVKKEIKPVNNKATNADDERILKLVAEVILETLTHHKQPWKQMEDVMTEWMNVKWFDEINIRRRFEKLSDTRAIEKATRSFNYEALEWFAEWGLNDDKISWTEFETKFKKRFFPFNYQATLLKNLISARQYNNESINAFINRIQILYNKISNNSGIQLKDVFKQGLHHRIRNQLIFHSQYSRTLNFNELTNLAIEVELINKLKTENFIINGFLNNNKGSQRPHRSSKSCNKNMKNPQTDTLQYD